MAVGYLAFGKLRDLAKRDEGAAADRLARKAMIPYAPAISLGMLLTFVPDIL
jgi:Flp pilus assembly protein protease CpaA